MASVGREKRVLRSRFQQFRESLAPAERAERSRVIVDVLGTLAELRRARTLCAYWPREGEIDIRPLLFELRRSGVRITLPVVDFSADRPAMTHALYESESALRPNRWGILEPADAPRVVSGEADAVIVPALGAGRNGHRIGYGRGYYDAFLSGLDMPAVCPIHAECLVDRCAYEPHDVAVTVVVTERGALRVGPLTQPGRPGGRNSWATPFVKR